MENISKVSLTLGATPTSSGLLCGYRVSVAAHQGVRGLSASGENRFGCQSASTCQVPARRHRSENTDRRGFAGRRIVAFFESEGGILSREDLAGYEAKWLEPIATTYRGYTIYTQPPNSSAVALLEELNIMEGFDTGSLGHNTARYLHRFMEAVRLALADRNRYVADTDAVPVPLDVLLSMELSVRRWGARRATRGPHRGESCSPRGSCGGFGRAAPPCRD